MVSLGRKLYILQKSCPMRQRENLFNLVVLVDKPEFQWLFVYGARAESRSLDKVGEVFLSDFFRFVKAAVAP